MAAVAELGFEGFEFNMKSVEVEDDLSIYRTERLVKDWGLKCLTLHAATLPVQDTVEVHRAVYYGKISADFAYRLGTPIMVVHSNVSRHLASEARLKLMYSVFREISPYAEDLGLQLALENLSYASIGFGKNVAELEEVLGAIGSESFGFTLDFCHAVATGVVEELLATGHEFGDGLCDVLEDVGLGREIDQFTGGPGQELHVPHVPFPLGDVLEHDGKARVPSLERRGDDLDLVEALLFRPDRADTCRPKRRSSSRRD